MDLDALWRGFCEPAGRRAAARVVALDGRQRRPRGHPPGPRMAAARRRPRCPDVRRWHGDAARRPRAGPARLAGVAGGGPARRLDRAPARPRVHGRHLGRVERGRWAVGRARRRDEEGRVVRDPRRGRPDDRGSSSHRFPTWPARTRTARDGVRIPRRTGTSRTGSSSRSRPEQVEDALLPARGRRVRSARRLVEPGRRFASGRRSRSRGTRTGRRPPGSSRSSTSR